MEYSFTFCMVTYNQEEYVIEALESIKYQVLNYGSRKNISLVVFDDCSVDKTFNLVKIWVENNKDIFFDTLISRNRTNLGTAKNVVSAIKTVKTNLFKLIAGDDVFSMHNVFDMIDLLQKNEFVTGLSVAFTDDNVYFDASHINNYMCFRNKKQHYIKKFLNMDYTLGAQGTAFQKSLVDSDLYTFLSQYKYIDDHPIWSYLYENNIINRVCFDHVVMLQRINKRSVQHNPIYVEAVRNDLIQLNNYHLGIVKSPGIKLFLYMKNKELKKKYPNNHRSASDYIRIIYKGFRMLWCNIFLKSKIESILIQECIKNETYLRQIKDLSQKFYSKITIEIKY